MRKIKYLILFFIFCTLHSAGQFYFIEDTYEQVEVEFLRKKIEVAEDETFFNVLKIKNPTNRKMSFETNFSYPAEWTFMAQKSQDIILNPSDSILIPFRAAPSINAKGEIGYAIVASLTDRQGKNFKNEYSFVNIPKISDLKFKPTSRVVYFDQVKKKAEIELAFINAGNTEEFIYVNYNLSQGVTTDGILEGTFRDELTLDANSDTVLRLPLILNKENDAYDRKFHRIQIEVFTKDTTLKGSIWAKELEKNYHNVIPYTYKMLNLEYIAQNLFSEQDIVSTFHISGYLLPKGNSSIHYNYQSFRDIKQSDDLWAYSRMFFHFENNNLKVEVGDIPKILGHSMYGRGAYIEYNTKFDGSVKAMATKSVFSDIVKYGGAYKQQFGRSYVEAGASYELDTSLVNSIIGFSNLKYTNNKIGSIKLTGNFSQSKWNKSGNTLNSYSLKVGYYYSSQKFYINLHSSYAPRTFAGHLAGRQDARSTTKYFLSNTNYLSHNLNYYKNAPPLYSGEELVNSTLSTTLTNKLTYNANPSTKLFYTVGGIYETKEGNNFYGSLDDFFSTNSYFAHGLVRIRNTFTKNVFSASITTGYNMKNDVSVENLADAYNKRSWVSGVGSVSYRSKFWGATTSYYHGPYAINQQFNLFYNGYFDKSIRVMPYVDIYIIPRYLRFYSRPTYIFDIPAKTGRLSVNSELYAYPGKDWEIIIANTYTNTTTKDLMEESKTTFSTSYFEFRIRKSFSFNQPKYQYHDLQFYFFKDLNGNNIKDPDEPGVKDVLLMIQQDETDENTHTYNTSSHFMPMDLLSDMNGFIHYENVPNGFYIAEYKAIGKMEGAFTSEKSSERFYMEKDKVFYIPFHENNKIFGKVILNRSKLSNLGSVEPANIKITAEDTKGKKYSTLTEPDGNFNIYVPNVDKYKVRVNNIFYENFELEQNDYEVQLNGYRQFEVNFVFNEKRRKIKFSSSYEYGANSDSPGIEIIRRTNLNGIVKDATTLQPIAANIRVVDKDGNTVAEAKSNQRTGIYTTSFVAGNDYIVEVSAEDYWFDVEKLYDNQIVTFKNLKKDILLKAITVGQFIPMKTLNFEEGTFEIPATSFPELEQLLKVLKKNPSVKISVHGHADDMEIQGTEADLALERAKLVAKFLIANGYNRVKYVGHANTKPIANNDTEDGRKLNRRVEIIVTGK